MFDIFCCVYTHYRPVGVICFPSQLIKQEIEVFFILKWNSDANCLKWLQLFRAGVWLHAFHLMIDLLIIPLQWLFSTYTLLAFWAEKLLVMEAALYILECLAPTGCQYQPHLCWDNHQKLSSEIFIYPLGGKTSSIENCFILF